MKLSEIKTSPKKGTYVGLRVLDPANKQLYQHCLDAGITIKKSLFDRRLHATLIYSRKYCPNIVPATDVIHACSFIGYDIFGQGDERILVIKLNAPSVVARHLKLMADHDAEYDHPTFQPHITLTYNFVGDDVTNLPPIDFEINLGEEYVEDLKLEWKE
jgi:hypothetical protein